MINERVAFFIDGTNLSRGLKEVYGIDYLDIASYTKYLAQARKVVGIYYAEAPYIQYAGSHDQKVVQQQKYLEYIRTVPGLTYRKGYYSKKTSPPTEKKTDVFLAVDMVDACLRGKFDVAFVLSGDADLAPAIDVLVREKRKVIVAYLDTEERHARSLLGHVGGYRFFINITRSIAVQFRWP